MFLQRLLFACVYFCMGFCLPYSSIGQDGFELAKVDYLRAQERKLILAKDILELYARVKSEGRINAENAIHVENKIRIFEERAKLDMVDFIDEFVPQSEIASRRAKAASLVDEWIDAARAKKGNIGLKKLQEATKIDPIALDAAILEGMHHYFFTRDYPEALLSFQDAAARGERYQLLHTDADKKNRICALNGCAVLSIRKRNTRKAYHYFSEIVDVASNVLPEVERNLIRSARLASFENSGVDFNKSETRKFEGLFDKLGLSDGGSEGWFLINPYNQNAQHDDLNFLVGQYSQGVRGGETKGFRGVRTSASSGSQALHFEDFVCVLCEGAGRPKCSKSSCINGVVEVSKWVWRDLPGGLRQRVRDNFKTQCPECRGTGFVDCAGCGSTGEQRR